MEADANPDPRNSGRTSGNPAREGKVFTRDEKARILFGHDDMDHAAWGRLVRLKLDEAGLEGTVKLGAGSLIPVGMEDSLYEMFTRTFPGFRRDPLPPLTRRQRIRYRIAGLRFYLRHLGLALLNRCDRQSWDE